MKAVLIQQDIVWADPQSNRSHIEALLEGVKNPDIVVLPEMFSTGFATTPEGIAENWPTESLEWMKTKAAGMDCAFAGSIATFENGKYYNRFAFVKPDGSVTLYDKHHLFTYGGEDKRFTAGMKREVVEWRGVRFLLAVCYDLRFPVWLRNRKDYDALICVASWPSPRRKAWDALVRARAIEDQCFVLAVNRVGKDPSCVYSGGTALVDPYGNTMIAAEDERESVIEGEIDLAGLEAFRKSFPVLNDSDDFELC